MTPGIPGRAAMKSPVTEEQSTSEKSRDGKKEKSNNPGPAAAGFLGLVFIYLIVTAQNRK
jgi:hypothetical protein